MSTSTITHTVDPESLSVLAEAVSTSLSAQFAEYLQTLPTAQASSKERRPPLLNVDEVAEYLAVSRRTVETLIAEGTLVPLRVRGTRRFTYEAIDAYLRSLGSKRGRV